MPYPDANSRSAQLFKRARNVLPDGGSRSTIRLTPYSIYLESASGKSITDVDGVTRMDFNNNYSSLIHGHAQPQVVAAAQAQAARGSAFSFGSEAEIALAELLVARVPSFERIRFMNSGTEAVMNAVKAGRAFTGRPKIAKCEYAYHGSYDPVEASLSARPGDHATPRAYSRGTPEGVLSDVVIIPFNDVEVAREMLTANAAELAAIVFDPFGLGFGSVAPTQAFIDMLAAVRDEHGVMLVADEVVAFRSDYEGCLSRFGVSADYTALGKIIGGGFPVGAVAGAADRMAVFEVADGVAPLPHGGTFNANPVTMAAGHAAMSLMTRDAFDHINGLGEAFRKGLSEALAEVNVAGEIRGQASVFSINVDDGATTGELSGLRLYLLNHGYFLGSGSLGCVSTAMDSADVDPFCQTVLDGLRSL